MIAPPRPTGFDGCTSGFESRTKTHQYPPTVALSMRTVPRIPLLLAVGGAILLLLGSLVLVPPATATSPSALGAAGGAHALDGGSDQTAHPSPFTWTNGNIALMFAGETPTFFVSSLSVNRTNVSVSVTGLAEVSPNGSIVAVGSFSQEGVGWNLSWTNVSNGVQVNLTGSVPVGPASGTWNQSEFPEQEGGGLGNAAVRLIFHLTSTANTSAAWKVKFDLGLAGWPWVSGTDHIGLVLSLHTVGSTSLEPGSDDVEEHANATGSLVATLTWAPTAMVTYANGTDANATVTSGTSLSTDEAETHVRLLFGGVAGGYHSLYYDPSVSLNPGAVFTPALGGSLPVWLGSTGAAIGIAAGLVIVGALVWVAYRGGGVNPRDRLLRVWRRLAPIGPAGSAAPSSRAKETG